ncbi:MAG TPA: ParA family protein [Adhaeribacter sp.]|nr:ParA family protein [Adhaeribacter sp.]
MAAKIISVINQKGGTGKTTTTINLGCALAELGKKVLLIDLDPQANLSYSLGVTEPEGTLADIFTDNRPYQDLLVERSGVTILPGANEMVDIEVSLINQAGREAYLKNILEDVKGFDYILIDCPPSLSILTVNALATSDEVLIPLQMEVLTLQGLGQILGTVGQVRETLNPKLKVKGIVVVMFDKRRKLSQEIEDYLHQNIDEKVFRTRIRLNVKLAEAPSFGQSILEYDRSSNGARDYLALAEEFLGWK